ncbi:FtsZ-interacting cell division protein ZipA [Pedobacter cryoconitis]|uniref:FtsZ-interacting cell division protein ZipA n=1 Tax=Pedobacter cryoconitis TaxID=188932 RepID=A0A7W8ZQZ6_9SPHI|nr:hypothetical protein [Pedobacter cryoconitis]MBB5638400.1 FtsZ-interacting cell division protein ZipA [Pedobacter cryoconitis]
MEINYIIIIPVIFVVILLLGWLVWRNIKDEKKFEKDMNESEIKPEKHDEDHI